MTVIYDKPKSLTDKIFHYCPGCHHGIVHRLVAEVIDELDIQNKTILVGSVGCSVFAIDYFDVDAVQAAHGRAPAVATGVKRSKPEHIVFTYQGDGDLAAIGTAEIIHAAARSENITVIFVNNAIYGMTGGQLAPTTLVGQKSTTSPEGRSVGHEGYPIRVSEMLATLEGATFIQRVSVHTPQRVREAKKAIKKAFQTQIDGKGFSMVEVVSSCPTNWGIKPVDCGSWIEQNMFVTYPLGVFKDWEV
jgi:2-oxoglutarate ferredoxin oxidoreductase subunit beta